VQGEREEYGRKGWETDTCRSGEKRAGELSCALVLLIRCVVEIHLRPRAYSALLLPHLREQLDGSEYQGRFLPGYEGYQCKSNLFGLVSLL
jgi:hypothetical protein